MQSYNKLLAGASWMGEYGNPDVPEEWDYIKKYSPYQNVKEGLNYPEVFFTSSTRDDRVHPGHARKMVAKMNEMGYKTYYYENTEGGHAGSSTNEQRAKMNAMMFSYLLMKLK
jgi:prolyl oligopeptidase